MHTIGEVVLRNLKLKREALDKLDLPVDVLEGNEEQLHGKMIHLAYVLDIRTPRGIDFEYTMVQLERQTCHGVYQ